jgi:hypothetical protein
MNYLDSDDAPALDQQTICVATAANLKVGSQAGGSEIRRSCRNAKLTKFVHWLRARAPRQRIVLIRALRETEFICSSKKCLMQLGEFIVRVSTDANWPSIAMVWLVPKVKITLKATEGLQDVFPRPFWISATSPLGIIFGNSTQKNARVDRT